MSARVLLVDDHPIMCAGLRLVIEKEPGLEVVGAARNGREALTQFRELAPDLVILDLDLGDRDGVSVAEEMLAVSPGAKIIVFSGLYDLDHVDRALKAGVHGYLLKARAEGQLIEAIHSVLGGQNFFCAEVAAAVASSYRKLLIGAATTSRPTLTERELEVLKLTAEGLRVKEIAQRLNIGPKTVDSHRSKLLAKLGCSSVADLTRYAVREGIVSP